MLQLLKLWISIVVITSLTLVLPGIAIARDKANDEHPTSVSASDEIWAKDLSDQSINMLWQELSKANVLQEKLECSSSTCSSNELSPIGKHSSFGLYIFVSTSMSKVLLKSYLAEASKYGGVLVFKGLPEGSFKELTKLITELVDGKNIIADGPSIQIDDEAFGRFNVTAVPTIVLVKDGECSPSVMDSKTTPSTQSVKFNLVTFDKITGNLGIRYALQQFSESGELYQEAGVALEYPNEHIKTKE